MANFNLKKKPQVIDDGEGNWLISYADLMTLLFGFFVIVSAFSTPDAAKMEKLKEATAEAMGGDYKRPFNELVDAVKNVIEKENIQGIQIEELTDGLRITSSSSNFFNSGSAELNPGAETLVTKIGEIILEKAKGFRVLVEGHTDDAPISTREFPSNWELSLRRASEVVRLFERLGVDHFSLRPVGMADVEPLIDVEALKESGDHDKLVAARAKNRRVIIRIQKKLPDRLKKAENI